MTSRTRFLITAAVVCHLLLAPPLVTSQLLSFVNPSSAPQELPAAPSNQPGEEITMRALEQEKQGTVYKLRGQAEIHYRGYVLYADEVTYDSATGEAHADGHVVLEGGPYDEHIEATHAVYNVRSQSGHFEHVVGTTGMRLRGTRMILTSPSPFAFTGKVVNKTSPGHYVVYDGSITSCELPRPKWLFTARQATVEVGANAEIHRSLFQVRGVPVFYLPYVLYPVDRERRQSGFLLPSFGQSSTKGTIVGAGLYWAMNRSMDGTVGAEYFSKRGWAQHGEFRAQPSETSFVDLNYFGVIDRGIGSPPMKQGGEDVRLQGEGTFHHNFRAVANIDYLSSFVFRLAFNEAFTQAVYSEVKSLGFLSNTTNGYSYNASVQRYQNFESTTAGDVITILHAPSLESSTVDRQIGRTPFYWSYDVVGEGLSRSEPGFRTAQLVGRFDLHPSLSMPVQFMGWALRPELSLRDTYYTEQLLTSFGTTPLSDPLNRKALEGRMEVRPPALERVFDKDFLGRKWKHVVEPRVVYDYVTGVNNFSRVLRFDERDILSNTNEVQYAVVNRFYAKRSSQKAEDCGPGGMPLLAVGAAVPQSRIPWQRQPLPKEIPCQAGPETREVVTWELAQKYFFDPTFGGALLPGVRNVLTTTADLTGIAFLVNARRLSPLISRLRVNSSNRTDIEWDLDYDFKGGLVNTSTVLANYHIGEYTFGAGDAYLREQGDTTTTTSGGVATPRFNQFRLAAGYGHTNKRGFSGAASVGFDATLNFLQYASVETAYNWDCCGLSVEYRRFALGSVRNENQYRFIFSLANIGSFGNLRRQEKLF